MATKLEKLTAMGPREIAFRLWRKIAVSAERRRYHRGSFDWSEAVWRRKICARLGDDGSPDQPGPRWLDTMRHRDESQQLLGSPRLHESAEHYRERFADRLDQVTATADRVCAGEFAFLGIKFTAQEPIAWQSDPVTGRQWPRGFHADSPIFSGDVGYGDVKHVWELNRHEYLSDCAKAYLLTGEERYARRVYTLIDSWIHANPFLEGVNWASTLEVAMRGMSWLWAYQFSRHWEQLPTDLHLNLIKSLYQHGHYLYRHLSFYFSPYNHLIGEATGLYLLGCFFPEFDESASWRDLAWSVLETEVVNQFHADGVNVEQATFYHNYCLGFYLLALIQREQRGEPVLPQMRDRLENALEYTMWQTRPDGTVPRIGDVDDARSIRFESRRLWDFRNLLSLGSVLFNRADMKAVAGGLSEDTLWLLGAEGLEADDKQTASVPAEKSREFTSGGYSILRSGWSRDSHHVCFDCGPIAAGLHTNDVPSVAHGHADLLSFTLTAFGSPILVDGGFYTYNLDPVWHRYFRETEAHNTVRIDGCPQAKYTGPVGWSCVTTPGPARHLNSDPFDFVECSHGGFHGMKGHVRHRRALLSCQRDYWIVFDRFEGEGEHLVEAFFHLAPGHTEPLTDRSGVRYHNEQGITANIQTGGSQEIHLETFVGGDNADGGWIATSYGERVRAPIVRVAGKMKLPASLCTVCTVAQSSATHPDVQLSPFVEEDESASVVRIGQDSWNDIIALRWNKSDSKLIDGFQFDGRLLVVKSLHGTAREVSSLDSSYVRADDTFVLTCDGEVGFSTIVLDGNEPEVRLSTEAAYELSCS